MNDHDQTTVGASDDLLAEVQAWVAQDKATPVPDEPEVSRRTEEATRARDALPPPSAEGIWRRGDDSHWRPPGRLAGSAQAPLPQSSESHRHPIGLIVTVSVVSALIGGGLVWALANRGTDAGVVEDPPADARSADGESRLGG